MRILVLTDDRYLYRRIELELEDEYEITDDPSDDGIYAVIRDADSDKAATGERRTVLLSRDGASGAYPIPLPYGKLSQILKSKGGGPRLSVSEDERCAYLDGKQIKLTSHEHALLSLLISSGDYVSRERIAREVWDNAGDGLINIYIHYLREKLETGGERIIIASRGRGYKISEKYLGGTVC